jgi:hypothetical protein
VISWCGGVIEFCEEFLKKNLPVQILQRKFVLRLEERRFEPSTGGCRHGPSAE